MYENVAACVVASSAELTSLCRQKTDNVEISLYLCRHIRVICRRYFSRWPLLIFTTASFVITMVMAEDHNYPNVNGVNSNSQDEELDLSLLRFWDFPMESFGVDDFVGEWDNSKSECLGPIPIETLMVPTFQRNRYDHMNKIHESKQLASDAAAKDSRSQFFPQMKSNEELGLYQTQSPVSALESSGSCSTGLFGAIPTQPRSKPVRQRPHNKPWIETTPRHSTESSAKTSNSKEYKVPNNRFSYLSMAVETKKDSSQKRPRSSQQDDLLNYSMTKKCAHCSTSKTPQWREGPAGPKTLCNACGVRYRSGRLFSEYRPAASPSFVPALHSNSHKKVMEMRNGATLHACHKKETSGVDNG